MVIEPAKFGEGLAFSTGAASASMQRALRKMSKDPAEARVFSQAKIFVPVFGSICLGIIWLIISDAIKVVEHPADIIKWIFVPIIVLALPAFFLIYGLVRRFGVDHDKVWTKFGFLFYREVRFDEVTKIGYGFNRYKLYAGRKMVNIDYNRFDYSLVYLRLLEELQHRRFELLRCPIDDPECEENAQITRNGFAERIYAEHKEFYANNPQALAYLNSLTEPPTHYEN
ncbi:hypothetical protein [Arcanobacterium pinnipediorum]|uniref:PH domain-containing protein n=1 Tax=Arcanobacterium pinnipediorum TaxID=1503041 RepID=A0ABY5AI09_9ACTO|nr:hypothetical protein [Arcanobacterium pinnipediorum]USR79361.1 hypothetical protein NG665_08325 [Arcanobacterium pinnipediorum]